MISLETQLDLAHRWLAQTERAVVTHASNPKHSAHKDLETCQAIVETIERAISCRDCANSDWPKETIAK